MTIAWSEDHARNVYEQTLLRASTRRRRRAVLFSSVGVACLAAVGFAIQWTSQRPSTSAQVVSNIPAPALERTVDLPDGSRARLTADANLVALQPSLAGRISLELRSGRARFEVVRHEPGSFRVVSGDVVVEVVGTIFSVERSANETTVAVEQGRVRVIPRQGEAVPVDAGQVEHFVDQPPTVPDWSEAEPSTATSPEPTSKAGVAPLLPAAKDWRALASEGDFNGAYRSFKSAGRGALEPQSGADLLLVADVARWSGHPAEAVAALRRLLREYPSNPRAALAAFTLGRIELEDLGAPRPAAEAFELCRRLDRTGTLDENALARAVEAWARAGEASRARSLARQYLDRYPRGSKRNLVLHHGSLD